MAVPRDTEIAKPIKLNLSDVDGVLTDGLITLDNAGLAMTTLLEAEESLVPSLIEAFRQESDSEARAFLVVSQERHTLQACLAAGSPPARPKPLRRGVGPNESRKAPAKSVLLRESSESKMHGCADDPDFFAVINDIAMEHPSWELAA